MTVFFFWVLLLLLIGLAPFILSVLAVIGELLLLLLGLLIAGAAQLHKSFTRP
jgi:hypothetical protein